jgi:transaldolase
MEIWLDTADLALIETAKQMGILYGVTTNPSIVAKSNESVEDLLTKLLKIQSGPVTVQVTAKDGAQMAAQGEALFRFSDRLVVKVPVTTEGLKAIHALREKKIPTMATAVFDSNQVLLAASAGASYIAAYFSAICEADMEGAEQFKSMHRMLDRYRFPSKLLGASLKSADQVRQCAELGAHAVTLNREVFLSFIENHPETTKRVDQFTKDWKTAKTGRNLIL